MRTLKVALVAGARPNFVKIAPLARRLATEGLPHFVIHTGQHYDHNMSEVFFEQLGLPKPDYFLGVGSGTHTYQTAKAMLALEEAYAEIEPDLVMVVGDVNSTLAGALAAVKADIPVAHVEAGLRSYDRSMPEEINRVLTDADENLKREGIDAGRIFFVGNIMIDTLVHLREEIARSTVVGDLGLVPGGYIYITLHRPGNVDNPDTLREIADALEDTGGLGLRMVFPVHPRTKKSLEAHGLLDRFSRIGNLLLCDPVGYVDSLALTGAAKVVLTDSGGLQEESCFLGVPCLTLRPNTERPITIAMGTNKLLDQGAWQMVGEVKRILSGEERGGRVPELWDGRTAERIVRVIKEEFFLKAHWPGNASPRPRRGMNEEAGG